jgi:AcrR family transcriptional regulator
MALSLQIRKGADIRKAEILEGFYQAIIAEGIEGASIAKISKLLNINQSLIHHYFKTKDNMLIELADFVIKKWENPSFQKRFKDIQDPAQRFDVFLDSLFCEESIAVVDTRVFYAFYYLCYRNENILARMQGMYRRFRDYLVGELANFRKNGIVIVTDLELAAEYMVTLIEGMAFHQAFFQENRPFEVFGEFTKSAAKDMLTKLNRHQP